MKDKVDVFKHENDNGLMPKHLQDRCQCPKRTGGNTGKR